jgi:exonuclease SbcD
MRLVHTSDWHLGRSLGGFDLLPTQAEFVDFFIDTVASERADVVVVAGDIFDRAIPPTEAVALWRETLVRLRRLDVVVVAIAGNHDGPDRVSAYDGLTDASGVYVRGGYDKAGTVLRLELPDGPLDVVAIPFLEPFMQPAPTHAGTDDGDVPRASHESVLVDALERARAQRSTRRAVVVAHAFVTGCSPSESERQLSVGGTGEVSAQIFDGFSYVALGHLHRPQTVAGCAHIRYSGTPLPYSFSETDAKHLVVVDLDVDGSCEVRTIAVPVGRPVATVVGPLSELLDTSRFVDVQDHFVRAVVTDNVPVLEPRAQLQERFRYLVEVELRRSDEATPNTAGPPGLARSQRLPLENALEFWQQVTGEPMTDAQQRLVEQALDAALRHEAAQ